MMGLRYERERADDAAAIARVVGDAFATEPGVVGMVAEIRASPQYRPDLAFVARRGDAVLGFTMISGVTITDDEGTSHAALSLTPLAVDPRHQRQGIGSGLVRTVLAAADEHGDGLVVLEGDPTYYGRLGFRLAAEFGVAMTLPDWAPPEAAQVRPLTAYDPRVRGRLVYPPAIAALAES